MLPVLVHVATRCIHRRSGWAASAARLAVLEAPGSGSHACCFKAPIGPSLRQLSSTPCSTNQTHQAGILSSTPHQVVAGPSAGPRTASSASDDAEAEEGKGASSSEVVQPPRIFNDPEEVRAFLQEQKRKEEEAKVAWVRARQLSVYPPRVKRAMEAADAEARARAEAARNMTADSAAAAAAAAIAAAARTITAEITDCRTLAELTATFQRHAASPALNPIHVSAAFTSAVRLAEAGEGVEAGARCAAQLLPAAGAQLPHFTSRELANVSWSLAKLGHNDPPFMAQLVDRASVSMANAPPQEIANIGWALATLGYSDGEARSLFKQLLQHARPDLSDFKPQEVASVLWSMSQLQHKDGFFVRVMKRLLLITMSKLRHYGPHELSVTAWAVGSLRYHWPTFMGKLIPAIKPRVAELAPQALSNIAWGLAVLNCGAPDLILTLARRAARDVSQLTPQGLTNLMWALAVADVQDATLPPVLLRAAAAALLGPGREPLPEQLRQVQQYIMTAEGLGLIDKGLGDQAWFRRLSKACREAWLQSVGTPRPSQAQRDVIEAVRQLPQCGEAVLEQKSDDGFFTIDIALQLEGGMKVAVEVDGPHHFMSNQPEVPDGHTVWRNRQLQARGWQVVSIPVSHYQGIDNAQERRYYLLRKFHKAGVDLIPGARYRPDKPKGGPPKKPRYPSKAEKAAHKQRLREARSNAAAQHQGWRDPPPGQDRGGHSSQAGSSSKGKAWDLDRNFLP